MTNIPWSWTHRCLQAFALRVGIAVHRAGDAQALSSFWSCSSRKVETCAIRASSSAVVQSVEFRRLGRDSLLVHSLAQGWEGVGRSRQK